MGISVLHGATGSSHRLERPDMRYRFPTITRMTGIVEPAIQRKIHQPHSISPFSKKNKLIAKSFFCRTGLRGWFSSSRSRNSAHVAGSVSDIRNWRLCSHAARREQIVDGIGLALIIHFCSAQPDESHALLSRFTSLYRG